MYKAYWEMEYNSFEKNHSFMGKQSITTYETKDSAKDALKWAAYTYVVAALGSLATLIYYVSLFLGGDE